MDAMVNGAPDSPLRSSQPEARANRNSLLLKKFDPAPPPLSTGAAGEGEREQHRALPIHGGDDIDFNKPSTDSTSNITDEKHHQNKSFRKSFTAGADLEAQLPNQDTSGGGAGVPQPWSGAIMDDRAQGHWHYSHRSPWLRALVLGANDGLVSISSLMLGVGAVNSDAKSMVVSGLAGLIAGAGSMAIGEFVSVFSQRDTELADIEKERQEHAKGPEAQAQELEELTQIYVARGLTYYLAKQVAEELSRVDVLKAHVRDELGIDVDALSNPLQAALASAMAFSLGGGVPLLAGAFIVSYKIRIIVVAAISSITLAIFGAVGARLGGAPMLRAALRVLLGGWLAMGLTYGILRLLGDAGI